MQNLPLPILPAPAPGSQNPPGNMLQGFQARSRTSQVPKTESVPWWLQSLPVPMMGLDQTPGLSFPEALQRAMGQAPEIAALGATIDQRRAALSGEWAAFDWSIFSETAFDRENVPVGSSLDGATNRLRQRIWNIQTGFRRRNKVGGDFSIYQDLGYRRSNSSFLTPPTQGTSRITAEYAHPLLKASGQTYNTGQIAIAGSRVQESEAQFAAGTENHLLAVAQAYWNLVLARGEAVLAQRALARTSNVADYMHRRSDVDVGPTQLLQAQAIKATRETSWVEATYEVSRAQELLLRLIYGDAYQHHDDVEIVTTSPPATEQFPARPVNCNLDQHPQVLAARQAIMASSLASNLARLDLQPKLDLVLSAYSAGLQGSGNFHRAAQDVWTDSEPGFSVGLQFEYPLGNRRAAADYEQSEALVRRLQHQFRVVVSDVALAIRDRNIAVEKASAVLNQATKALDIARQDLNQLETRRNLLLDGSRIADLYLDALLRAQGRLSDAERRVLRGQVDLEVARASQQHACGRLRQQSATVFAHPN